MSYLVFKHRLNVENRSSSVLGILFTCYHQPSGFVLVKLSCYFCPFSDLARQLPMSKTRKIKYGKGAVVGASTLVEMDL